MSAAQSEIDLAPVNRRGRGFPEVKFAVERRIQTDEENNEHFSTG